MSRHSQSRDLEASIAHYLKGDPVSDIDMMRFAMDRNISGREVRDVLGRLKASGEVTMITSPPGTIRYRLTTRGRRLAGVVIAA